MDMIIAVVIFVVGSTIHAGAVNIAMLFIGESLVFPTKYLEAKSFARTCDRWTGRGNAHHGHPSLHFRGM